MSTHTFDSDDLNEIVGMAALARFGWKRAWVQLSADPAKGIITATVTDQSDDEGGQVQS
jgi:hypothetical protein